MKVLFLRSLLLMLVFVVSCEQRKLNMFEYLHYFKEPKNGFIQTTIFDSIELKASILSREYMTLIGLGEGAYNLNSAEIDSAISEVEDFTYILLEWDKKKINSKVNDERSYEMRMLLNNELPSQFFLESNGQLIPCVICNPEVDYYGTKNRLWLGFAKNVHALAAPLSLKINSKLFSKSLLQINFIDFSQNNVPNFNSQNL